MYRKKIVPMSKSYKVKKVENGKNLKRVMRLKKKVVRILIPWLRVAYKSNMISFLRM
jgi:hypothetical protein